MNNLSATYRGVITGLLMIVASIGIFYYRGNFENGLQYIVYCIYIAGIVWALAGYKNRPTVNDKKFKNYFAEGFKCFIVITLLMVAFTFIFLKMNPALKEEMAKNYQADLIKTGNYTVAEIETMVNKAKEYFITMLTSMAIFGYLLIGALVTLIASAFFSQYNKK